MKREYDFRNAKRGPVVSVRGGKTRITIRIDDEILAWFRDQVERAGGGNYQTSTKRSPSPACSARAGTPGENPSPRYPRRASPSFLV